jgi:predicted amidohydrolase YtcJ
LGSDTPVEHPNPFITLAAAETRQDEHHEPALGFLPDQVMTRTEAIDAYTRQAAMALGEATMGIIKTGAVADMIWIPDNILQVKPDALRKIKPSRIWISGQERPVL